MNMGMIAFRLFSEDVNSLEHPKVQEYKSLLENMANATTGLPFLISSFLISFVISELKD